MTQNRTLISDASAGLGSEFARQLAATGHNLINNAGSGVRVSALGVRL